MSESSGGDGKVPINFKVRKAVDSMRFGSEYISHFHREAVSRNRAEELFAKLEKRGRLSANETGLLSEYERTIAYTENKTEGKVLVMASGFDGIPSSVFGENNVVMTSLRETVKGKKEKKNRYFDCYRTYLNGTEHTAKVEADMYDEPFARNSFSTLILNGMDIFNEKNFIRVTKPQAISENIISELFGNARKLIKTGGVFIITDQKQAQSLTEEIKREIEALGWKLKPRQDSPVLKCYEFIAV